MTTALEIIKSEGWEKLIKQGIDYTLEIDEFDREAEHWDSCAVGEIMGFPSQRLAEKVISRLPRDLVNLGSDFHEDVCNNDAEQALNTYRQICESKMLILETLEKVKAGE